MSVDRKKVEPENRRIRQPEAQINVADGGKSKNEYVCCSLIMYTFLYRHHPFNSSRSESILISQQDPDRNKTFSLDCLRNYFNIPRVTRRKCLNHYVFLSGAICNKVAQ